MTQPAKQPALLSDADAERHLTQGFLEGTERLRAADIDKVCEPFAPMESRTSDELVELLDEARERHRETPAAADAWLAPRLHATVRLNRRDAADGRLWNHMALRIAPDYVHWRHPGRSSADRPVAAVNPRRFSGPFHTQAFSRLWWAAELFRDGYDYDPVATACADQDVLNTVLRLEILLHRPTAQAFASMMADGTVRTGREVNALAKAVNSAGSTLAFEVLAPDAQSDAGGLADWINDAETEQTPHDTMPIGPDDGRPRPDATETLVRLFTDLLENAPVRGRDPEAPTDDYAFPAAAR